MRKISRTFAALVLRNLTGMDAGPLIHDYLEEHGREEAEKMFLKMSMKWNGTNNKRFAENDAFLRERFRRILHDPRTAESCLGYTGPQSLLCTRILEGMCKEILAHE